MQTQIEVEHWIKRKFVLIETSKAAFFVWLSQKKDQKRRYETRMGNKRTNQNGMEKQKKKDVVMASVCAMSVCVSVCCEKYVQ